MNYYGKRRSRKSDTLCEEVSVRKQVFLSLMLLGISIFCSSADAQETSPSVISIPVSVDLDYLEQRINAEMPGRLATVNESNMLCVPAEWAKWDYPCFRGIKWYTCEGKTKITPDIYCDVNGYVDRRGGLSISGSGGNLLFSMPVHASITAKAVVQETAKADATFFVSATPRIDQEWNPSLIVESDFRWDNRPELSLFNFIKITIGSRVEPELREKMKEFESKIPSLISELGFKSDVQEFWNQIQEPIQISTDPKVFALFKPAHVGFSGIHIEGRTMTAQISIGGETSVIVGDPPTVVPIALLPLNAEPISDGFFSLSVPAVIEEVAAQAAIDKLLTDPLEIEIAEGDLEGIFSASNVKIAFSSASGIKLRADVSYDNRSSFLAFFDVFDWFDFDGTAEFEVVPVVDADRNVVLAQSIRLDTDTSSSLADTLVAVLDLPLIRDRLARAVQYDFSGDLIEGIARANEAMNVSLADGIAVSGKLEAAGARDLAVMDGSVAVFVHAKGNLVAQVGQ